MNKWKVAIEEAKSSRDSYPFDPEYLGDGVQSQEFLKFGIFDMTHKAKKGMPTWMHNSNFGLENGEIFDNLFDCEQVYNEVDRDNTDYKIVLILTEIITTFFRGFSQESDEKVLTIEEFLTPV